MCPNPARPLNRFAPLLPGVAHVPYPYTYRFGEGKSEREYGLACAKFIEERLFKTTMPPEEVAAIFVEAIQGEGGYVPAPPEFLRELRAQFGNLGLAAAAYNAGPGRVQAWLAGHASLPGETRAYVMAITGHSAETWRAGEPREAAPLPALPCTRVAKLFTPSRPTAPAQPNPPAWGVQLAGNWSEARALASYDSLKQQYPAILGGRQPLLIHSKIAGRGPAVWTRIRIGADTRESAEKLCSNLKSAGGSCIVLRN